MKEIYVSTDIEADGPIPGPNSMLSFASAAFTKDGRMLDTFSANLYRLQCATSDPKTMKWWETDPDARKAWKAGRKNLHHPENAIPTYARWLKALPGKPVFVAYPASYDFMFIYWYLMRFAGESPFGYSALDIKSYAMAKLGGEFQSATKKNMPEAWMSDKPHTHKAIDDAIGQGILFCNMLNAR